MAISPTIKIRLVAEMCEADGSKCLCCGDKILVNGYELVVYGVAGGKEDRCGSSQEKLCRTCGRKWREDDAKDGHDRTG